MAFLPRRGPFYLLALAPPLWLMTVGPITSEQAGKSPYMGAFAPAAGSAAACSWIWIAVLMSYSNSKPTIPRTLARSSVHIASFIILTILWLGFGIMLATQTAIECRLHTPRCSSAMFCVALALLTSIFSCFCAFIVCIATIACGSGFSIHVALARQQALASMGLEEG
ncbi:hypothetical protein F5887DRAFT_932954 [Amanita rubescens]|nr:hypothetical protein F5887DRAFT_932954 [Amanita rubescens]